MRRLAVLLYLFLVVNQLAQAAQVDVNSGFTYEVNLLVVTPLEGTSWLGLYGLIGPIEAKPSYLYYEGPFAVVTNLSPTNEVREVELNLLDSKTVGYPSSSDENNWYVVISPADDVNLRSLTSTCETNLDELVEGNFRECCTPSSTYSEKEWILVNDTNLCAKSTALYEGIRTYLLEWNNTPVYLTLLSPFELEGNTYNFALLVSVTGDLYLYLTRKHVYCGDGVCDPGEETNCGDCISLILVVDPDKQEINVGETTSFTLRVTNDGNKDITVSLSVEKVAGGDAAVCNLTEENVTVAAGSELPQLITCGSSETGSYVFRVRGSVGEYTVYSNTFYLVVTAPEEEEEGGVAPAAGGGVTEEENVAAPTEENKIVVTPRGYYIPWLGCISYLHVFSPDEVRLGLGEEKNVPVVVQNAGTCDENIVFSVEGVDSNFYRLYEQTFLLPKRSAKTLTVTLVGAARGIYTVEFVAKGYYTSRRKMTLVVYGGGAEERGCKSNVMLLAPDVVEVVEGEELNAVVEVQNNGTCIEDVRLRLTKRSGNVTLVIDTRSLRLPGGERFVYAPPRLAAGEYTLEVEAGGLKKTVTIVVRPRSAVANVVSELIVRARFAILVLLLLVLLGAVSYIRQRYLS